MESEAFGKSISTAPTSAFDFRIFSNSLLTLQEHDLNYKISSMLKKALRETYLCS